MAWLKGFPERVAFSCLIPVFVQNKSFAGGKEWCLRW